MTRGEHKRLECLQNVDFDNGLRRCSKCETWLPFSRFAKCTSKLTGTRARCKDCQREDRQEAKKAAWKTAPKTSADQQDAIALDVFYRLYFQFGPRQAFDLQEKFEKEVRYINENPALIGFKFVFIAERRIEIQEIYELTRERG